MKSNVTSNVVWNASKYDLNIKSSLSFFVHIVAEKSFLLCFELAILFKYSTILVYIIPKGKQGVMMNRWIEFFLKYSKMEGIKNGSCYQVAKRSEIVKWQPPPTPFLSLSLFLCNILVVFCFLFVVTLFSIL